MSSTIYDIAFRYTIHAETATQAKRVEDNLDKISRHSKGAADAIGSMASTINGMLTATAGFVLFGQAREHLLGFNQSLEDTEVSLAGILSSINGVSFSKARNEAKQLVAELEDAPAFLGSSAELATSMTKMMEPLSAVGASAAQAKDLTIQLAAASQMYRIDQTTAAQQITQAMMTGTVTRSLFVRQMLADAGMTIEQFEKIKDRAQRADIIMRGLSSERISEFIDAKQNSFSGQWAAVVDTIEETIGLAGRPLFAKIIEQLKEANAWLKDNKEKVEEWARSVGSSLVSGFEKLASVARFIVDHDKALIAVAVAWAGVKVAGSAMDVVSSLGDIAKAIPGAGALAARGGQAVAGIGSAVAGSAAAAALGTAAALTFAATAGWKLGRVLDEATGISKRSAHATSIFVDSVDAWGRAMNDATTAARAAGKKAGGIMDTDEAALKVGGYQRLKKELELVGGYVNKGGYDRKAEIELIEKFGYMATSTGRLDLSKGNVETLQKRAGSLASQVAALQDPGNAAILERVTAALPNGAVEMFKAKGTTIAEEVAKVLTEAARRTEFVTAESVLAKILPAPFKSVDAVGNGKGDNKKENAKAPNFNVGKIEIQVQTNDPNDIVVGMQEIFRKLERNPARAQDGYQYG